jgi:hypothetical protein
MAGLKSRPNKVMLRQSDALRKDALTSDTLREDLEEF